MTRHRVISRARDDPVALPLILPLREFILIAGVAIHEAVDEFERAGRGPVRALVFDSVLS